MTDEMRTIYWLSRHPDINMGLTVEMRADAILDGLPAPSCLSTWCTIQGHRMSLVDKDEYDAVLGDEEDDDE